MNFTIFMLRVCVMISCVNCSLIRMFNKTADGNIGQLMDTVALFATNNAHYFLKRRITEPIEQLVKFICGHRNSFMSDTVLNDSEISFKMDLSKPVAFVIHGWNEDANRLWVQDTAQQTINYLDVNVCIVQWKQLAAYYYELAAVENTLLVSGYMTQFIRFLNTHGFQLKDIFLIGHSLGAHICGQVGYNFDGEIAQIYGLDPARALFTEPVDRGLQFRLDKSDANYVQMIITSRGLAGVRFGDGHANFYPNGGTYNQPNCEFSDNPKGKLKSDAEFAIQLLCSHLHSTTLFRLSLNPWIVYLGHRCTNYARYLLGLCNDHVTSLLGVYSNRAGGDFYLRTTSKAPYSEYMPHIHAATKFLKENSTNFGSDEGVNNTLEALSDDE